MPQIDLLTATLLALLIAGLGVSTLYVARAAARQIQLMFGRPARRTYDRRYGRKG